MPGATSTLKIPYPVGGDAPDGPGGIQTLAQFLENDTLAQGAWVPGYGGDSGASLGADGGTGGFAWRVGRVVNYRGRILFGSSAVAGGGVITGFNLGANDVTLSHGRGFYIPAGGGAGTPIILQPVTQSDWKILVGPTLAAFSSLGNPSQSSQIFFEGTGIVPAHA